jgi:hypothetical protein
MIKLKLPRKQKKALKNIRFTKRWLEQTYAIIAKASRRVGNALIADTEMRRIEILLSNPYPETKWVRKIRNQPFVKHLEETRRLPVLERLKSEYIRQALLRKNEMKMEGPADEHEAFEMCNPNFEVDKTILHEGGLLEVVPKQ